MRRRLLGLGLSIMVLISFSCSKDIDFNYDEWKADEENWMWGAPQDPVSVSDTVDHCWPSDSLLRRTLPGVEATLRRARQLLELKWKPYASVPSCYGVYKKNKEQQGVPYSLAFMTHTQLGTQVSLHTFMTALKNPFSVLYSENLGSRSYGGGGESSTYYGSTCSNSLMYVLGIEPPYFTRMIGIIPGMEKTENQDPSSIELCDVIWITGHVMMVYDIIRKTDNTIDEVQLFETTTVDQADTRIRRFSFDEFVSYWKKNGVVRYRYANLERNTDYEISVFVPLEDEPVFSYRYNYEICPTLGDRSSYMEGQTVVLSVLNPSFQEIALYRNNEYYTSVKARTPLTSIPDLPYGKYKACLVQDGLRSGFTRFEVLNAEVNANMDDAYHIHFSSKNASARYIAICDGYGNPYNYYLLTDDQREQGLFEMRRIKSTTASHYQVCFKGAYGIVATKIKSL